MVIVAKDVPLNEITLRKYEKPYDLEGRDLIKKICLSIGLLQPGDSRDVMVDVLYVLLEAKKNKKMMTSEKINEEVIKLRKKENLALKGIAGSNIRRQLKRLRDLFLIENINNQYRISEFEDLDVIFEKRIEGFYINGIIERIKDYFKALK